MNSYNTLMESKLRTVVSNFNDCIDELNKAISILNNSCLLNGNNCFRENVKTAINDLYNERNFINNYIIPEIKKG